MDEDNLKQSLELYKSQLSQVEQTLQAAGETAELLQLRDEMKQLISLTEDGLVSLMKSKMLTQIESGQSSSQSVDKTSTLEDEYAAFQASIGGSDDKSDILDCGGTKDDDSASQSILNQLQDIVGMKCRAPFLHEWGSKGYFNAIVTGVEKTSSPEEIPQITVMYCNPTSTKMVPCSYHLEGRCSYDKEWCKYSHGNIVDVEDLKEFKEPNYSCLQMGTPCLAQYDDDIWYRAKIVDILDNHKFTVSYDNYNDTRTVDITDVLPLDASNEESDDDSDDNDNEYGSTSNPVDRGPGEDREDLPVYLWKPPKTTEALGSWEAHTKKLSEGGSPDTSVYDRRPYGSTPAPSKDGITSVYDRGPYGSTPAPSKDGITSVYDRRPYGSTPAPSKDGITSAPLQVPLVETNTFTSMSQSVKRLASVQEPRILTNDFDVSNQYGKRPALLPAPTMNVSDSSNYSTVNSKSQNSSIQLARASSLTSNNQNDTRNFTTQYHNNAGITNQRSSRVWINPNLQMKAKSAASSSGALQKYGKEQISKQFPSLSPLKRKAPGSSDHANAASDTQCSESFEECEHDVSSPKKKRNRPKNRFNRGLHSKMTPQTKHQFQKCPFPSCNARSRRLKWHAMIEHVNTAFYRMRLYQKPHHHFARRDGLDWLAKRIIGPMASIKDLVPLLNQSNIIHNNSALSDDDIEIMKSMCKVMHWEEPPAFTLHPINSPSVLLYWRCLLNLAMKLTPEDHKLFMKESTTNLLKQHCTSNPMTESQKSENKRQSVEQKTNITSSQPEVALPRGSDFNSKLQNISQLTTQHDNVDRFQRPDLKSFASLSNQNNEVSSTQGPQEEKKMSSWGSWRDGSRSQKTNSGMSGHQKTTSASASSSSSSNVVENKACAFDSYVNIEEMCQALWKRKSWSFGRRPMKTILKHKLTENSLPKHPVEVIGGVMVFDDPSHYPKKSHVDPTWNVAFGVHPKHAPFLIEEQLNRLSKILKGKEPRALGVIGFDYTEQKTYWDFQEEVFINLLDLSQPDRPIILHVKGVNGDVLGSNIHRKCLAKLNEKCPKTQKIQLHSFTGTPEDVRMWMTAFPNCYFGFTWNVEFFNEIQKSAIRSLPLDRILIETGSVDELTTTSKKTDIKRPSQLGDLATLIAEIRGENVDDLLRQTLGNGQRLHGMRLGKK